MVESIIIGAFGDRIIEGFMRPFLDRIKISDAYDYIKRDADLGIPLSEMAEYRGAAKQMDVTVDTQMMMRIMRKRRPDLASLILNCPNGLKWLDRQVALLNGKLA
jgi:hypothetical protein